MEPLSQGSASAQQRWAVYAIAAIPILIKLICYPTYPGSDDAFIHLTIVRNVTHSLGWGINPGEPINLSSSPLYTLLVSLLSLVGFPALPAGEWLSALSGFFGLVFLHRLLVRLGLHPLACISGVIIAASNLYLWRWNGVVMESTLGLFLMTLAYWLYHAPSTGAPPGRYLLTGAVVGLATLTRFELALVVGCFGLCEMANRSPKHWIVSCLQLSLGFLAVIAPWFIFCHFYFHELLPTTFYAKTASKILLWNPSVLRDLFKLVASGDLFPLLGIFVLLAAAVAAKRVPGFKQTILPRLDVYLFPLVLTLFYYTKTPAIESAARYFLPALHLLATVFACVFDALSRQVPSARLRPVTIGFLAAHLFLSLVLNQWKVTPILSRFRENYWSTARNAADYLKSQATTRRPNVLVEVDIGMLSYYAGGSCYFIDGGALATPSLRGKSLPQQVAETRPDLVIETLGLRVGAMSEAVPALRLLWHQQFHSHSLTHPSDDYITNIYENEKP